MSTRIVPLDYQGQPVSFNSDGWLNASKIAEQFGKRLDHWFDNAGTLEYIQALDEVISGQKSEIVDARKSGYVKTSRARADRGGGTWLHPKLAVAFARWCNAKFAAWCDLKIDGLLRGGQNWANTRREAAIGYRAVCDAVLLNCEALGKTPKKHHFIVEAKLINAIVAGAFAGRDRDQLNAQELEAITLVELRDSMLIARGMPYAERKTNLQNYMQGLLAKQIGRGAA